MTEQEYKLTMDELGKEYKENYGIALKNAEKAGLVRVNSLEVKTMSTLMFSLIPYLGFSFAMMSSDNLAAMTGSVMPGEFIPAVLMVGSLVGGTIIRKIYEHNSENKERFESFSDSKTETERVQERFEYLIEKEKAENRKKAIKMAMDSIEADQNLLNRLTEKYEVRKKNIPSSALEVQTELEQLTSVLEEKLNELDVLSIQSVLHDKTCEARLEKGNNGELLRYSLLSGLLTSVYYTVPTMGMSEHVHYGSTVSSVAALASAFVIGSGAVIGFSAKKRSDYMKAFNDINATLGEDSLPETLTSTYEERQTIVTKLESTINEVAAILINIEETKRTLESLYNSSTIIEGEEVEYPSEDSYSPSM